MLEQKFANKQRTSKIKDHNRSAVFVPSRFTVLKIWDMQYILCSCDVLEQQEMLSIKQNQLEQGTFGNLKSECNLTLTISLGWNNHSVILQLELFKMTL